MSALENELRSQIELLQRALDATRRERDNARETLRLTRDGDDLLMGAEERAQAAESSLSASEERARGLERERDQWHRAALSAGDAATAAERERDEERARAELRQQQINMHKDLIQGVMEIVGLEEIDAPSEMLERVRKLAAAESSLSEERARREEAERVRDLALEAHEGVSAALSRSLADEQKCRRNAESALAASRAEVQAVLDDVEEATRLRKKLGGPLADFDTVAAWLTLALAGRYLAAKGATPGTEAASTGTGDERAVALEKCMAVLRWHLSAYQRKDEPMMLLALEAGEAALGRREKLVPPAPAASTGTGEGPLAHDWDPAVKGTNLRCRRCGLDLAQLAAKTLPSQCDGPAPAPAPEPGRADRCPWYEDGQHRGCHGAPAAGDARGESDHPCSACERYAGDARCNLLRTIHDQPRRVDGRCNAFRPPPSRGERSTDGGDDA